MTRQRDSEESDSQPVVERIGRNLIAAVGINQYRGVAELNNAVRDAEGTVACFERLGFAQVVAPVIDEAATGGAIWSLVTDELHRLLQPSDSLVLFYAGHGKTRRHRFRGIETGYLMPVNAKPDQVATWIDLGAWLRTVARLPARHILVVLDACHSGITLEPSIKWRDVSSWQNTPMSTLATRASRRIITSAMGHQVARDDGPIPGQSLFTGCLIEGLSHRIQPRGGRMITGSELGVYLQERVRSYQHSRQTPDFGTFDELDERGEMLIRLPPAWQPAADSAPPTPPRRSTTCPTPSPLADAEPPVPLAPSPAEPTPQASGGAGGAPPDAAHHTRGKVMKRTLLAIPLAGLALLGLGMVAGWRCVPHENATPPPVPGPPPAPPKLTRLVIGVNDFGGAFPAVVANDGMKPGPSSRFTAAGLDVEFRLLRDSVKRLNAFDAGDVNVVLVTLDYLANLVPTYRARNVELRAFLMADWSRGTLGIVAEPRFASIEQLGDARIATTQNTPSHYFLLTLLAKSNLKPPQIDEVKRGIVFVNETRKAGEMFARGEVQAAAIWEPYLSQAIVGGKGYILMSTQQATNLVPDVLFARADFLTQHAADMVAFTRVWLQGVDMLGEAPERWLPVLASAFHQSPEQTRDLLNKTKLARFADDREFFGLDKKAAPYLTLFDDASRVWQGAGVIKTPADAGSTRWLDALDALSAEHASERLVDREEFSNTPPVAPREPPPLTTSIYFENGSYRLGPSSRQQLDRVADTLQQLGDMSVTVVGNTDSTGDATLHARLSTARAQAVVDYLVDQHHLQRARFSLVGNGMEKPRGDNTTPDGREENRRVDFRLYAHPH